jgi:hypothetical protein
MKILTAGLLVLLATGAAADEEGKASKAAPLFTGNDVVPVTITAPLKDIMADRSVEEERQGTLVYTDAESGEEVTLDIGIRSRGRFRRKKEVCTFTPLRLNFRKTKDTLFAKSDKMKLVTHCRTGSIKYEQGVLKEYIAYRILNTMTDWSFRVRPLRVTYVESASGKEVVTSWAFLIEEDSQLAKRVGMKIDESERTTVDAIDGPHTNIVSLFHYLIGNTDFSPIQGPPGESCCHNHVLLGNETTSISVPYDFDVTGIVSLPHAVPNPRFKLSSVKKRLYRGRCANNQYLEDSFQAWRDNKPMIYDLINSQEGLSNWERKRTISYVDEFYKIINSERQVNSRIVKACLGK